MDPVSINTSSHAVNKNDAAEAAQPSTYAVFFAGCRSRCARIPIASRTDPPRELTYKLI